LTIVCLFCGNIISDSKYGGLVDGVLGYGTCDNCSTREKEDEKK